MTDAEQQAKSELFGGGDPKAVVNPANLLKVEVTNENIALNLLVAFLGLAQKRGVFAISESAKIYECIKQFQRP